MNNYFIDLSDELLDRKIELCHELLDVANILEPGLSRFRGYLLDELQATLVFQARRDFSCEKVNRVEMEVREFAFSYLENYNRCIFRKY